MGQTNFRRKLCEGVTKNGRPCRFWAKEGENRCPMHPEGLGDLGSINIQQDLPNKRKDPKQAALQKVDTEIASLRLERIKEMQDEVLRLETPEDLKRFIVEVISDVRKGSLDAKAAAVINSLLNTLKDLIEKIAPVEDAKKQKEANILIIAENMTIGDAWQFLQNPALGMKRVEAEAAKRIDNSLKLPKKELDLAKKEAIKTLNVLFGPGNPDAGKVDVEDLRSAKIEEDEMPGDLSL